MEANLNKVINMKISRTVENLEKNNIKACYVPTKNEALALVKTMLKEGETVAIGGSVTLVQTGITDLLKNGNYNFIDRSQANTREERTEIQRRSQLADTFLMSSNAITEDGFLYNVDGTSNRLGALLYGPKRVIIVAGINKIVPNLKEAEQRVKNIAAPANAIRLDRDSYCAKHGHCCYQDRLCTSNEVCKDPICSNYVTTGYQINKDRITVIIVGEELGY